MVQYFENGDLAIFDGEKFRRDKKTGYYLSSRPIGDRRKRLHVAVWEHDNGEVPAGFHVHHKDENKGNNEPCNFELFYNSAHVHYHGVKYTSENYDKVVQNLNENARPKASEWHKSADGRAWHSEQAKINAQNMQLREYICQHCGERFYRKPTGTNKYCSNNCKSAARRASGVDDISKTCECCGGKYIANKYQRTRYCSTSCNRSAHREHKASGAEECVQHGSGEAS